MNLQKYSASKLIALGQLCLAIGVIICSAIRPHLAFTGGGISNYGVIAVTIPFFSLAFIGGAFSIFLAARRLNSNPVLKRLLYILASLFLATLLTTYTYKFNDFFDVLHQDVSIILGLWEILCSVWLIAKATSNLLVVFAFMGQLLAAFITILTILGWVHILFLGEILSGISFGILLAYGVGKVPMRQTDSLSSS